MSRSNLPLSSVMQDTPRGPVSRQRSSDPNFDWITSEHPAKSLTETIKRVVQCQTMRLWDNTRLASLYSNTDFMRPYNSAAQSTVASGQGRPGPTRTMPRQTANFIKVYTDTLAGKLVQANSRVNAATIRGDWKTFKLARKLDRALDATFMEGDLYKEVSKVAVDALKTGTGYLHIGEDDGKVIFERWFYNEIFVDPLDAAYGCPTMLFRTRYMKRENALAKWGKDAKVRDALERAPIAATPAFAWCPYEQGMISIYEGWALSQKFRKGRHILCVETGVIVDNKNWDEEYFPVVPFRASDLPLGWYGQGFAHDASGAQIALNMVLDIMAQGAKLGIAPFWTVPGNAGITVKQLNNVPGHVVTSDGPEPKWNANAPFHEAATQYTHELRELLGIIYGISPMESQGQSPQSRYDSNPALVQLQDMWATRHAILLKNWSEHFFLEVGRRTVVVAQRIASKKGSYPVIASRGDRAWAMDWADFKELKAEAYRLKLATENALPLTPEARKKLALEMFNNGLISREKSLQMMMGPPDLEAATAEIAAYENNADMLIEALFDGEMPTMSGLQKPEIVLEKVRQAGLMAYDYGAPDEITTNFETFAAQVADKIQQTQAAMMPPPGAPGASPGAPNGTPALSPTSGLSNV